MGYHSQGRQDSWVEQMTNYKNDGFFVEVGALDGVTGSNTLHAEEDLGWKGICIEANPMHTEAIRRTRPNSFVHGGIAVAGFTGTVNIDYDHLVDSGGISVPCDTLTNLLDAANCPTYIDYMSVDIEGGEYDALASFDFDKYTVMLITVEHNLYCEGAYNKDRLYELLSSKGFDRIVNNAPCHDLNPAWYMQPFEDWYINKSYLETQVTTFVTIHSEELVWECHASERFKYLSNIVYLCVGSQSFDNLPEDVNAIICKDYTPNWEHYPSFYDFTGWACLAEHKLIKTPYAIMLQYDHAVVNMAVELPALELLRVFPSVVGYVAAHYKPYWMLAVPNFRNSMIKASEACGGPHPDTADDGGVWPTTQGTAWSRDFLYSFMEWFKPTFEAVKDEVFAGHIAERMVKLYTIGKIAPRFLPDRIIHQAKDCHGTGSLMSGNKEAYELKSKKFFNV